MNEKKIYESCVIDITYFSANDVIATSGWGLGGDSDSNKDPDGWT